MSHLNILLEIEDKKRARIEAIFCFICLKATVSNTALTAEDLVIKLKHSSECLEVILKASNNGDASMTPYNHMTDRLYFSQRDNLKTPRGCLSVRPLPLFEFLQGSFSSI